MAWSFFEKLPIGQTAKFVSEEIQLRERKKDLREHWPKCLLARKGDVEKAKEMFVEIVFNKPEWLAVVRLVDPPRKAEMLGVHVGYLLRSTSFPASFSADSAPGTTANLKIESNVPGAEIEIDGAFIGNTPSNVTAISGNHRIVIKKKGFLDWSRTLNVTGGLVNLSAELEREQPEQ